MNWTLRRDFSCRRDRAYRTRVVADGGPLGRASENFVTNYPLSLESVDTLTCGHRNAPASVQERLAPTIPIAPHASGRMKSPVPTGLWKVTLPYVRAVSPRTHRFLNVSNCVSNAGRKA